MRVAIFNNFLSHEAQRAGWLRPSLEEANDRHACNICLSEFNALTGRGQRRFGHKYIRLLQFIFCVYVDIFWLVWQKETVYTSKLRVFDGFINPALIIVNAGMGDIDVHHIYSNSLDAGVRKYIRGRHEGFEPSLQIRNFEQNKKASKFESLLIYNYTLAGHVSLGWNQIYLSLLTMYEKLRELEEQYA